MRTGVRRSAAVVLVGLLAAPLAGCASDPDPSPPAGVDELTIPTPAPDPDDFVDEVDNPWLALGAGESATLTGSMGEVALVVGPEPTTLDGVPVTSWTVGATSYLLAQDRDGNVWSLTEDGEAGLFMAATPRYGDGYGTAYDGDTATRVAEVSDLEDDTLEITTTDPAQPGSGEVATYEKGVGLVRLQLGFSAYER
jgi:hypothetical protein